MIASVRGTVLQVGLDRVVVEVGGVGLLVHTTAGTASGLRPGAQALLATSLVVREESLTLYGFAAEAERELFEQVQTVSGVGPRLALAMLSVHEPDVLRAAIAGGDLAALTKIPGIGKKGAERIVLELKDKVVSADAVPTPAGGTPGGRQHVVDALVGLGWSEKQAQGAVEAVAGDGPAQDVPGLLRLALRELGR